MNLSSENRIKFCLSFFFGLLFPVLVFGDASKAVMSRDKRQKTLERGEASLTREDDELKSRFSDLKYPFAFEVEKVIVATTIPTNGSNQAPPPPPPEKKVTDREVLERISSSINPTGSMSKGGKGILLLRNGKIEEGQVINARVQGAVRKVVVERITREFYVLRLNQEKMKKYLNELVPSTQLKKDSDPDLEPESDLETEPETETEAEVSEE